MKARVKQMTNYEILSNNGEWILKDLRLFFDYGNEEEFIEKINSLSRAEVLDAWLNYQGINGYADDIILVIIALLQGDDSMQNMNLIDEVDFDATLNGNCDEIIF